MMVKIWDKDNFLLLGLLVITFVLVYYSPDIIITRVAFLLFLIPLYFSKKDYIWLAWIFIIVDAPGYLFKGGLLNDPNRIPVYPLISSISISFFDLAILILIIKCMFSKRGSSNHFIFINEIRLFIGLIVFFLAYSIFAFSFDPISFIRTISPWAFIYIFFKLLDNELKLVNFSKLIFPIVLFALILVIYYLSTGVHFVNLFKGEFGYKTNLESEITDKSIFAARSLFSVFIILYSVIMALVYLRRNKSIFPKYYLILIISASFLTCFLTATRGYLISVSFILIASLLSNAKNLYRIIESFVIIVFTIIIFHFIINATPTIKKQYELAIERYNTIELLLKGDITAGGTVKRLDVRGPRVMAHVKEYPILGYGFSKLYYNNADGDVGFFSVLLNLGFLGTLFLYLAFFSILGKIFKYSNLLTYRKYYYTSGFVYLIGLLGIHVFHLTTNVAFGILPSANSPYLEKYMIYALLLTHFNQSVNVFIMAKVSKNNSIIKA